jgi:hypothetical protein
LIEHIHVITSKAATKLQPALGGGWLLTGHNQKRIYWVWSYVQYRSGYRMVVNENIFYPKENKPSNIHIVWKIGNKSRTTLVCRGFGHFFTYSGLFLGSFFWKYQNQLLIILPPAIQTIFRNFATGNLPYEKTSLLLTHRA